MCPGRPGDTQSGGRKGQHCPRKRPRTPAIQQHAAEYTGTGDGAVPGDHVMSVPWPAPLKVSCSACRRWRATAPASRSWMTPSRKSCGCGRMDRQIRADGFVDLAVGLDRELGGPALAGCRRGHGSAYDCRKIHANFVARCAIYSPWMRVIFSAPLLPARSIRLSTAVIIPAISCRTRLVPIACGT